MVKIPFIHKKDQSSDVPQEVQDYYKAEKRERVGVAGLLAAGTLVVTIVLALALYFGGRWVYRTVFDDKDQPESSQQEQSAQEQEEQSQEEAPAANDAGGAPGGAGTTNTDTSQTPPTNQPTQSSTQNNSQPSSGLPRTGPANMIGVFFATVFLASVAYYFGAQPKETE